MKSKRKSCRICSAVKPLSAFYAHKTAHDRHRSECKACNNSMRFDRAKLNAERELISSRKRTARWRANHTDRARALGRVADRKRAERKREYMKQRRRSDPNFNLAARLRTALWLVMKGYRTKQTAVTQLGCSIDSFKIYIESLFEPGMTWENYGKVWSLDHIMPLALFDLTKTDHLRRACHVSNIQPMFIQENKIKSNKVLI